MCTIEILRDHSKTALKLAVEANLLLYVKSCVISGEEVVDSDEVFRWYCGSNIFLRNWVLNAKFTPKNVQIKVKEQMEYFRQRKVTFLWWNGPSSKPANLGEVMQDAGMMKFELPPRSGDMVKDIRNLEDLEEKLADIVNNTGIEIRKIQSMKEMREGVKVIIKTTGMSEEFQRTGEISCELMLQEDPNVNVLVGYVAYLNGVPVSVSTVYYGAGVAGIYSVGTLRKYQHRGIGTAITLAPLIDARKRGFEIAVLTATTKGFPIYERIGFKKIEVMEQYVRVSHALKRFLYRMYFRLQRIKNRIKRKQITRKHLSSSTM